MAVLVKVLGLCDSRIYVIGIVQLAVVASDDIAHSALAPVSGDRKVMKEMLDALV